MTLLESSEKLTTRFDISLFGKESVFILIKFVVPFLNKCKPLYHDAIHMLC